MHNKIFPDSKMIDGGSKISPSYPTVLRHESLELGKMERFININHI